MKGVYIGLGSNLGARRENIERWIEILGARPEIRVKAMSSFFETRPVGDVEQGDFINAVAELEVTVGPSELLRIVLDVESKLGRVRRKRWGPRTLDLDLLIFGPEIIDRPGLKVPHPLLHERRFVLEPLQCLAPDLVHPLLGKTVARLLGELEDDGGVRRLET